MGCDRDLIGLGVAGNFAGHLEQAGEAGDFRQVKTADAQAPKGLFPFYVPGAGEHPLHCDPLSATLLRLGSDHEKHQIEPEVALRCDVVYRGPEVAELIPRQALAHNDCSIRREGARKISEKKNWGPESKGTALSGIEIDRFSEGGVLDRFRLCSFLERDGELFEYGVDSALTDYSYFYERLLAWVVDRMNHQRDAGPLEDISRWLEVAGRPSQLLISIGATRYTDFGERTFLARGDRAIVALYDATLHDPERLRTLARAAGAAGVSEPGLSWLDQRVV
ncbi:MAG: DUF5718 family protein [Proteobacteria bacterium]|nr:DUF5718 family protein [Pseudomonadota bacterium]